MTTLKLSTLNNIIISFFVLIMIGALRLFPDILGDYNQLFLIDLYAIMISIIIFFLGNFSLKNEIKFLNRYFFFYIIFILVMGGYSFFKYQYSLESFVKNFYLYYLVPFCAYGIVFIFHHNRSIVPFLSLVSKFVLVMLALRMLSWALYNYQGIIIFPRILFQYEEWVRNGLQRIETGMLFGIALSYIAVQAINNTWEGAINKILLVFMVLFLLYVTQVRFQTTLAIITILIPFIFYKAKNKNVFFIKLALLGIAGVFFVFNTQYVERFLMLISTQGQYGESSAVRYAGINHYFSMILENNAYWGLGILIPSEPIVGAMMARTKESIYYLDDLGMLGSVIQFGFFAIVTHLLLFVKSIQVLLKSRKVDDQKYFLFLLTLTFYMVVSQLLLNMFDRQRIFEVPFYLAIYSYLDAKLSNVGSISDFDKR